jgi:uncharacterized Fe-S radical SAM superfamily protein PflX
MEADPIKAEYFYGNEKEKIKLNWFCYEYAFGLYTKIRESPELEKYRKNRNQDEIVKYCVYFSKAIKRSIHERINGLTEETTFYEEYVEWFYPKMKRRERMLLMDAAGAAWDELLSVCEVCPSRCISEMYEKCIMFDRLDEDGFLI